MIVSLQRRNQMDSYYENPICHSQNVIGSFRHLTYLPCYFFKMMRHVHHKASRSESLTTRNIIAENRMDVAISCTNQAKSSMGDKQYTVSLKQRYCQKLILLKYTKSPEQTALISYNFLTELGISRGTVIISANIWKDSFMISVRFVSLMKERESSRL